MLTLAKFFLKEKSNNNRCVIIMRSGIIRKELLILKHILNNFFSLIVRFVAALTGALPAQYGEVERRLISAYTTPVKTWAPLQERQRLRPEYLRRNGPCESKRPKF